MELIQRVLYTYRKMHLHQQFYKQLLLGIAILLLSFGANYAANLYVSPREGNAVNDMILDLLPVVNLDYIYLEGFLVFIIFIVVLGLYRPNRLPFMLKTIGLFILIRSFFITLTHLSLPLPGLDALKYAPTGSMVQKFSSGNDLFFSGHTGLPFLISLIFWKDKLLRYIFLGLSIFFGVAVLFAHVHYSIDVFAAFFITYAIYQLAVWLFTKDHRLFHLFQQEVSKLVLHGKKHRQGSDSSDRQTSRS
jgi:membrane-associated phospholipid phosphatase